MKNIFLFLCFILFSTAVLSQYTEGHITFKIDISTNDEAMKPGLDMMKDMTMEVYFKDEFSRSNIDMGFMSVTSIINTKSQEMLMLMGGMLGNKAIVTKLDDIEDEAAQENIKVKLIDEKKDIAGCECKKAIITHEDGSEVIYWYTTKIEVAIEGNQFMNAKVPGFPMEINMNTNGMLMNFIVNAFDKKVENPDEIFSMVIPDGYEKTSLDALQGR